MDWSKILYFGKVLTFVTWKISRLLQIERIWDNKIPESGKFKFILGSVEEIVEKEEQAGD